MHPIRLQVVQGCSARVRKLRCYSCGVAQGQRRCRCSCPGITKPPPTLTSLDYHQFSSHWSIRSARRKKSADICFGFSGCLCSGKKACNEIKTDGIFNFYCHPLLLFFARVLRYLSLLSLNYELIPRAVLLLSYSLNDSIRRSDYTTRSTLSSDHNDAKSPGNLSIAIVICAIIWSPLLLTLSPPSAPWLSNSTKTPQKLPKTSSYFRSNRKLEGTGDCREKHPGIRVMKVSHGLRAHTSVFNTLSISIHDLRYMACL
jgi:hypothetical protein